LFTLNGNVTCCSFYNGSAVHPEADLIFRPSLYFEIRSSYEANSSISDRQDRYPYRHRRTRGQFHPLYAACGCKRNTTTFSEISASLRAFAGNIARAMKSFVGMGQSALFDNRSGFVARGRRQRSGSAYTFRF